MIHQHSTSRYLSVSLLLLLVFSLSISAMPCVCAGSCHSESEQKKSSLSDTDGCHFDSDGVNSEGACASDAGKMSEMSSTCSCNSTPDARIVRLQTQRSTFLVRGFDVHVPLFSGADYRFETTTDVSVQQFHNGIGFDTIPAYLHHSTFLL